MNKLPRGISCYVTLGNRDQDFWGGEKKVNLGRKKHHTVFLSHSGKTRKTEQHEQVYEQLSEVFPSH